MERITIRLSNLHFNLTQLARNPERGANLVEYALLIGLIVVVCLSALTTFGQTVPAEGFGEISSTMSD